MCKPGGGLAKLHLGANQGVGVVNPRSTPALQWTFIMEGHGEEGVAIYSVEGKSRGG